MNNFFIRKVRKVINGIPITVMEKVPFVTELGQSMTDATLVPHSSLAGLTNNDHPQYALSSETFTRIQELADSTQASINALREGIETGELNAQDLTIVDQPVQNLAATTGTFDLAGLTVTTDPPAPDEVLVYSPETDSLVWRSIFDVISFNEQDLSELEAAIAANAAAIAALQIDVLQIAINADNIETIQNTIDGYADEFNSDYIKTQLLHLTFNVDDSEIDPAYPYVNHGIQWQNHGAVAEGFYGLDVGGNFDAIGVCGDTLGYHFGGDEANRDYGITDLAMRFSMSNTALRGWVWSVKGPGYTPVMGLTAKGQLLMKSGITFLENEPVFYVGSGASASMAAKDDYVFTYDHALQTISLEAVAGGVSEYTNVTFDDLSATTVTATGSGLYSHSDIYLNHLGPDGNSYIYFYDTSSPTDKSFGWVNSNSRFETSTAFHANGLISTSSNINVGALQNRDTVMYMNIDGADSDAYFYWYDKSSISGQYIQWDDSEAHFVFSTGITVNGPITGTGDINTEGQFLSGGVPLDIVEGGSDPVFNTVSADTFVATGTGLISHSDLYLNHLGPDGDSTIYFYDTNSPTGRYIRWDDSRTRFEIDGNTEFSGSFALFRSDVQVTGSVSINYINAESPGRLYFHNGASAAGAYLEYNTATTQFGLAGPLLFVEGSEYGATAHTLSGVTVRANDMEVVGSITAATITADTVWATTAFSIGVSAHTVTIAPTIATPFNELDATTPLLVTANLPQAEAYTGGVYHFQRIDNELDKFCYINAADKVDGFAQVKLWYSGQSQTVVSNGEEWKTIGHRQFGTKIFYVEDPGATEAYPIMAVPTDTTIVRVSYSTDAGTVDFNLEERFSGTPGTAGADIWTSDMQASSTASASTDFNNTVLDRFDWLYFVASATGGTPTKLWITVTYIENP